MKQTSRRDKFKMPTLALAYMSSPHPQTDWEKDIVDTKWTDRDTDAVVQYTIDTEYLNLKDVDELD